MFCREEDDHIFVAFCDLGVGIPITLPKTMEENKEKTCLRQFCINCLVRIRVDAGMVNPIVLLSTSKEVELKSVIEEKACWI